MPQTVVFDATMPCGGCSGACTRILNKCEGVTSVDANLETQKITVVAEDSVDPQMLLGKLQGAPPPRPRSGGGRAPRGRAAAARDTRPPRRRRLGREGGQDRLARRVGARAPRERRGPRGGGDVRGRRRARAVSVRPAAPRPRVRGALRSGRASAAAGRGAGAGTRGARLRGARGRPARPRVGRARGPVVVGPGGRPDRRRCARGDVGTHGGTGRGGRVRRRMLQRRPHAPKGAVLWAFGN